MQLQCTTAPGYGTEHYWSVTIDGQTSPATIFPWSTSYAAPAITSVATQDAALAATMLSTTGGDVIVLTGTNFGPTGAAQGPLLVTYTGTVTGTDTFTAAYCAVTTADTQITCTTVVGVGAYFAWTVEVGGQASPASIGDNGMTSFAPPNIDSVVASPLLAAGGGSVVIIGSYFGPVGTPVSAVYTSQDPNAGSSSYAAASCAVLRNDIEVECVAAPGVGMDFTWVLSVGGQESAPSSGTTSYAIPVVNALQLFPTPAGANGLNTAGGDEFNIHGRNFGPAGTPISVVYESNAHGSLTPECTVVSDALASCTSVAGTGVGYVVTVHVGDQNSAPSAATLNYGAPIITGVNTGVDSINQVKVGGGTVVMLTGQNFGPVDAVHNIVAGTFGATGIENTATNCAVVVANVEIQCTTVAASGSGHHWRVVVDAQHSNSSAITMSFAKDSAAVVAAAIVVPGGILLIAAILVCVCRGRRSAVVRCVTCGACGNGKTTLPRSLQNTSV